MTLPEIDTRLHELVSLYWQDSDSTTRDALVRFGRLAAFAGYSAAIDHATSRQKTMAKWALRAEDREKRRLAERKSTEESDGSST
jgi:hypothetical protein